MASPSAPRRHGPGPPWEPPRDRRKSFLSSPSAPPPIYSPQSLVSDDDSDVRATGGDRPPAGRLAHGGALRASAARPCPAPGIARPGGPAPPGLETDPDRERRPRRLPLEPGPRDPRALHGGRGEDQRGGLHRLPVALGLARRPLRRDPDRARAGDPRRPLPGAAAEPGQQDARPLHPARGGG